MGTHHDPPTCQRRIVRGPRGHRCTPPKRDPQDGDLQSRMPPPRRGGATLYRRRAPKIFTSRLATTPPIVRTALVIQAVCSSADSLAQVVVSGHVHVDARDSSASTSGSRWHTWGPTGPIPS